MWLDTQKRKFKKKKFFLKPLMPPEHLRKLVRDRGDMSSDKFKTERRIYVGALKYLPHAILKLIENIPMPWEESREVQVLYHNKGAITFINEVPKVIEPIFRSQWATMWTEMRREKRDRTHFKRMRFPPFDDEEPPLDFSDSIMNLDPLSPIQMELDQDEDSPIIDWFYEHHPLEETKYVSGYKKWRLDVPIMGTLYRLGWTLLSDITDPNYFFLFDLSHFKTSKALNTVIPGGPRFEPLYRDIDPDDWTEFNDLRKLIIRGKMKSEYQLVLPYLYSKRPRSISIGPYHFPMNVYIRVEDPNSPAFLFHEMINPLLPFKILIEVEEEEEEFNIKPFLSDLELETSLTADGIRLYHAPYPYNKRSGYMIRVPDVPLVKSWFQERCPRNYPVKVRVSYQKLIKCDVLNHLHKNKGQKRKKVNLFRVFKSMEKSPFERTEIEWVEAGLQLCKQGYNVLQLLLKRKNVNYLHLDYNFTLKPIATLTTKERKRSRFGNAFHLIRELLKFTKFIVDAHVQFRLGNIDAYQLSDALQYIFSHVGHLTGIYRYKYRVMRQIRKCKDLKHLIYYRFNTGPVGKGPGVGFWFPMWRVWIHYMRGTIPLLERWLSNMLSRRFEGRISKASAKTITKQRVESNYDNTMRIAFMREVMDVMPEGSRSQARVILQHLSESWRCWKAGVKWEVPGMPEPIDEMIDKYINHKADWYMNATQYVRKRIQKGEPVEKTIVKKNLGRLTRLKLRYEMDKHDSYMRNGPEVTPEESTTMQSLLRNYLSDKGFSPIPFPSTSYKHDTKILILALNRLKETYDVRSRLNQPQREELGLIDQAFDNPHQTLTRIKSHLLSQHTMKEVGITFLDLFSELLPVYEVDSMEKITDAYLDQYLWYEAEKRGLFPNWIKPSDSEPVPVLIHQFCSKINSLPHIWNSTNVLVQTHYQEMYSKIDFIFLRHLLMLAMDHNLANYIVAKNNVEITYKDMTYLNTHGLIRGLQFAGFVGQFYGLVIDLLVLGKKAKELILNQTESQHPIRLYLRYMDKVWILFTFDEETSNEEIANFLQYNPDPYNENIRLFPVKTCWNRDQRTKLFKRDVNLGFASLWSIQTRVPKSIARVTLDRSFISVYSEENSNILFDFCGFEIRMIPRIRQKEYIDRDGVWTLRDKESREPTCQVHLKVSKRGIERFTGRVRNLKLHSAATTFSKVSNKWNTLVIGLLTYYREAVVNTPELLQELIRAENAIQNRIKSGLNSKMPNRFPPVVFYCPKELGGLGMISMGHVLIPQSDLRYSIETPVTHFRTGLSHKEMTTIPNLYRYIIPWEAEIEDSARIWADYNIKREQASRQNRRLTLEDLVDSFGRGIPRINTLFSRERHTLCYDKGFRIRQDWKKFTMHQTSMYWWVNPNHDGKLWNLKNYRSDMIEALGGADSVIKHTLFAATGFPDWKGLFWERSSAFEDSMRFRKLTNAQMTGLNQVPNRRFALWWSPTVNRSNVYIGYQVQLDLTGIFMHGKLPTLKISYVQIFRAHMWQKIHESIVHDLCSIIDDSKLKLGIDRVQKEIVHPRKSYKLNSSCADIILFCEEMAPWPVSRPEIITGHVEMVHKATKYWIDIQIRWGDYDSHDIVRYSRRKFLEYTSDAQSFYPSPTGTVIAIDIAYNIWSAYGAWIPGIQDIIIQGMAQIMKKNGALAVLRERIRTTLCLYSSEPIEPYLNSTNFAQIFSQQTQWFVDDTNVFRINLSKTHDGHLATRPRNGCLTVISPRTGELFLKILHMSVFAGQKKLGQLTKWKAAEEVGILVGSLPLEQQPKQIIVTDTSLLDPLEVHLIDFPNTIIKGSELQLPFQAIMRIEKFHDAVEKATESKTLRANLFDDWLTTTQTRGAISPFTAFSRVILIMRSLQIDPERTRAILRPDISIKTRPEHIWPSLTDQQWIEVEKALKDIVLADFGRRNSVNVDSLTTGEIKDIILGMEIAPPDPERLEEAREEGPEIVVQTTDKHGERITVKTTSNYEKNSFIGKTDWRLRAIAARRLHLRRLEINEVHEIGESIRIPENLIKRLIRISDGFTRISAFIYGDGINIQTIAIPPQIGTQLNVHLPSTLPEHILLDEMKLMGVISIVSEIREGPDELISEFFPNGGLTITLAFIPGAVRISVYNSSSSKQLPIIISERIKGYFLIPDQIWNYHFTGIRFQRNSPYGMIPGIPLEFFHHSHRPDHFRVFSGISSNMEEIDNIFE